MQIIGPTKLAEGTVLLRISLADMANILEAVKGADVKTMLDDTLYDSMLRRTIEIKRKVRDGFVVAWPERPPEIVVWDGNDFYQVKR